MAHFLHISFCALATMQGRENLYSRMHFAHSAGYRSAKKASMSSALKTILGECGASDSVISYTAAEAPITLGSGRQGSSANGYPAVSIGSLAMAGPSATAAAAVAAAAAALTA